ERARDAHHRRAMGIHLREAFATEVDATVLWRVDTVDAVEQRTLAGAVRSDDGAHFVFAYVERDSRERLYTTECERDIFHSQDDTADGPFHCAPSALRAVLPWGSELLRSGAHLSPL